MFILQTWVTTTINMEECTTRLSYAKRSSNIPRDGKCRFLYDIWQPLILLTLTACFMLSFSTNYNPSASKNHDDLFFCNADGSIEEKTAQVYNPLWDPQMYFTINIAFGEFAFSVVKIIDALWDTIVDRGGQMIAGLVTYRVLRRSLTLTKLWRGVQSPSRRSPRSTVHRSSSYR